MSNNPPDVILDLTFEEAKFLVENCEANLNLSLQVLPNLTSRDLMEKLVNQMEMFKTIRKKLQDSVHPDL